MKIAIAGGNEELAMQYAISLVRAARREKKNRAARAVRQAYSDCGMKRVRGALGGVYYE